MCPGSPEPQPIPSAAECVTASMSHAFERRLLQLGVALASLVPLSTGTLSVIRSADVLRGVSRPLPIDLDSHYRYLSGLLLGIGIAFVASIPRVEAKGALFRTLGFVILVGGLGRLISLLQWGAPGPGHQFGLAMELVVVPAIVLWQARIERLYRVRPDGIPR